MRTFVIVAALLLALLPVTAFGCSKCGNLEHKPPVLPAVQGYVDIHNPFASEKVPVRHSIGVGAGIKINGFGFDRLSLSSTVNYERALPLENKFDVSLGFALFGGTEIYTSFERRWDLDSNRCLVGIRTNFSSN